MTPGNVRSLDAAMIKDKEKAVMISLSYLGYVTMDNGIDNGYNICILYYTELYTYNGYTYMI